MSGISKLLLSFAFKNIKNNVPHVFTNTRKNNIFCCNFGICPQKLRILSRTSKYAPNERIKGIYCVYRKPANFCHPARSINFQIVYVEFACINRWSIKIVHFPFYNLYGYKFQSFQYSTVIGILANIRRLIKYTYSWCA